MCKNDLFRHVFRQVRLLTVVLGPLAMGCNDSDAATEPEKPPLEKFSFFVTSLEGLQRLSGTQAGFGGDLRFGESGEGAGLRGADKICSALAEASLTGAATKGWRAFLSASTGGVGAGPSHAIDRVGDGPWYDRLGRVVALAKADLTAERPLNADPAIVNDLPNEFGVPNHAPDPTADPLDNHDILTGSTATGLYYGSRGATCQDWTSAVGTDGTPRVGHSWPRTAADNAAFRGTGDAGAPRFRFPRPDAGAPGCPLSPPDAGGPGFPFPQPDGGVPGFRFQLPDGGVPGCPFLGGNVNGGNMNSWASALDEAGCAAGSNLIEMGPPNPSNPTVGSGGGYGGFYCFALTP